LLWMGIALQLSILAYCKYAQFFAASLGTLLTRAGFHTSWVVSSVMLPLGLSFFTFQLLSYLIDVYRNTQEPTRNLADFALYIAFFPKMMAGPIERASHFLPQLQTVQ